MSEFARFAGHLYGNGNFHLALSSNDFQGKRTKRFDEGKTYAYPLLVSTVEAKIAQIGADGFDAYICAHGIRDSTRGRVKFNAAFVHCLWADLDGAPIPTGPLAPTMVVETSPNRWQVFYKLSRALEPQVAEALSHRLTDAIGADAGGWMLTKLVRPAGSISYKHGTPFTVRIAHLETDRTVDPNDLARILPAVKEAPTSRPITADSPINPGDEPPILLSPTAMAVWRGERPVIKRDGSGDVDRSESLFKIACALWECGATRRTIVTELADRDMSLGWERYTGRPAEYERIADKVAGKPRLFGPIGTANNPPRSNFAGDDDPADDDACDIRLARTIAENDQLRAKCNDLQQTVDTLRVRTKIADQRLATYQNNGLGSAKPVAAALIQIFAAETPRKPDEQAGHRVPLGKLADITGLSEDACSRQVKLLATYNVPETKTPVIFVDIADVGGVDKETGEIIAPHKELWLGPGVSSADFGDLVSTIKPGAKPKWGGRSDRGTCADHPDDGVIERVRYQKVVTYECAICNHPLEERSTPVAGKAKVRKLLRIPTPHDAALLPTHDIDGLPMPHLADTISTGAPPTVADTYTGKMRHRPEPRYDARPGSLADAWQRAEPMPGFGPTPLDQFTDSAIGGKP